MLHIKIINSIYLLLTIYNFRNYSLVKNVVLVFSVFTADDGVVFQVKKSSQSKKIMKLLDRERKKKKESKSADIVLTEEAGDKLLEDTSDLGVGKFLLMPISINFN